ncbi:MAG: chemotaxis protein CheC [Clostridiales bacterium]|jgi:chemotaxis protein CheC|nr:CheC, inhibitor of methylation [Oscillospiraceae bacterium]MDN5377834.1 chemotaxis protein CheC [Clostridiales bacterium]
MSVKNLEELNPIQIDVLREIGNIGSGNAATSLSGMLSNTIDIGVPVVKTLEYEEVVDFLGGPENVVIGLLIRLSGDIKGMMMYILQSSFANVVLNTFYGKQLDDILNVDEMDKSAISEIGNIMAGSYVNAIAGLTGLTIDISPPSFCVDMVGAILSVPAIEFAQVGDRVIFIDDNFKISNDEIKSNMILIPEMESLSLLFNKLGVEI